MSERIPEPGFAIVLLGSCTNPDCKWHPEGCVTNMRVLVETVLVEENAQGKSQFCTWDCYAQFVDTYRPTSEF